jgi:hypothetical protein
LDSSNREAFTSRILSALAMEDNAMAHGGATRARHNRGGETPHQSLPACVATARTHRAVPAAAMHFQASSPGGALYRRRSSSLVLLLLRRALREPARRFDAIVIISAQAPPTLAELRSTFDMCQGGACR